MKTKDFKSSLINEIGASMIEYVLMLALICVVAIASAKAAGEETRDIFAKTGQVIATAGGDVPENDNPPPPPP